MKKTVTRFAIVRDSGYLSWRDDLGNWVIWMFDKYEDASKYAKDGDVVVPMLLSIG